jgi:hypothetical protein
MYKPNHISSLWAVLPSQPVLISIMAGGSLEGAEAVEVSGLNIGWGPRQPLALNPTTGRWEHTAHLPIGKFLYKYAYPKPLPLTVAHTHAV